MIARDQSITIPERDPGERADHYLERIRGLEAIEARARKEALRMDRRINSEIERALIHRAVKKALSGPRGLSRARVYKPRSISYEIPDRLWLLFIFAPLYLLLSLIFQDRARPKVPAYEEIELKRIPKGPGRALSKRDPDE